MRRRILPPVFSPILALALFGCATGGTTASLRDADLPWNEVAQPGQLGMKGVRFAMKQFRLPSGMMVVVERAPTRGMVGVIMSVAAGSAQDPPGKEGLAHYVEHLTFRAASGNGKPTVDEELARLGATFNATTDPDFTRYYEFAPASNLPALLELVSRRLSAPVEHVDPKAAATERAIVTNELYQRNHTGVYGQVLARLQAAVFPADHPYSRPTIGTVQSIAGLSLADAQAFTAAHYKPANATLVLVGEFPEDPAALSAMVRGLPKPLLAEAGDTPHPPFHRLGAAPPAPPGGAYKLQAAVTLPEVWLAWPLPSSFGQDGHLVRLVTSPVLQSILSDLTEDDGDIAHIDIVPVHARQGTMLACGIQLWNARRRDEIAKKVASYIQFVWSLPADPRLADDKSREALIVKAALNLVLESYRSRAFAQIAYGAEPYEGRALARAEHLAVMKDASRYTETIQRMITAKPDEVAQFALKYLDGDRMRRVDVDSLPDNARPPAGPVRTEASAPLSLELGPAIDFGSPPRLPAPPELADARQLKLENGMTVVLVRRTNFPSVAVALGFPGGDALSEPPGVRDLIRNLQPPEGSSMPFNAVEVKGYDRADVSTELVKAGAENLPTALALLVSRLVRADRIDWEEFFANREGKSYVLRGDLPEEKAQRALFAALYGGHPYGRFSTATDRHAIDAPAVRTWLARTHQPRNARLVVVGDVDLATAERQVRTWFGPWRNDDKIPVGEVPPVPPVPPGAPQEKVIVTHRAGVPQTEITLACRVPGSSARDELVARSLAAVLGGNLTNRLRTDAGITYGVSGRVSRLRGGAAHMLLHTAVDNARLKEVMRLVRAHWTRYAQRGFEDATLSQVRWSLSRQEWMSMQTSSSMAMRLMDVLTMDGTAPDIGVASQSISDISTADLKKAFDTCASSTVISLVGDEEILRKAY